MFRAISTALLLAAFSASAAVAVAPQLIIDLSQPGFPVSPTFYGMMTEEINHAYDGGLYAELVQNRSFKDDPKGPAHWSLVSASTGNAIALDETLPINAALTTCLKLTVGDVSQSRVGVANEGYWGIPAVSGTTYHVSFFARSDATATGPLLVSLESTDGRSIYASGQVAALNPNWARYSLTLAVGQITPDAHARLVIYTTNTGNYWFNLVSLFPPTWHNRPNGNRVDIMKKLVALHPAFLRFPGGNYLEGYAVSNRFAWQQTLGDLSQRPGHTGPWGYRSTDGMGLLEFLEWAEDMGAEPVLAVYAGFSLPSDAHHGGIAIPSGPDLAPYVQEALDEIEYVSGSVTTTWGARRAADGHAAPFPLHYVEIGNEDFVGDATRTYNARFAQFFDAIKAAHPDLQFIATVPVTGRVPDVIDDHYYATSTEMMKLAHKYDRYDRRKPKIFVGEWATREIKNVDTNGVVTYNWMPWGYRDAPTPNLHQALGDAAFMTGLERNSDIIVMNCYAPLLTRVEPGAFQWNPNLIGYNSLTSYESPSYYAQQMFQLHRGDTVVPAHLSGEPDKFFYSATRKGGTVYLKVVNLNAAPTTVDIQINGVKKVARRGSLLVLTSARPEDTNTLEDPAKVAPVTTTIKGLGRSFTRTFAPYSINVLQLETQ